MWSSKLKGREKNFTFHQLLSSLSVSHWVGGVGSPHWDLALRYSHSINSIIIRRAVIERETASHMGIRLTFLVSNSWISWNLSVTELGCCSFQDVSPIDCSDSFVIIVFRKILSW